MSETSDPRPETGGNRPEPIVWWALPVDLVAVVVFAIFGRSAHGESADFAGIAETAWPFLVALLVTWIAREAFVRSAPGASALTARAATAVWAGTLVLGMIIRGLATGKVPHWSFMIVAAIALAILFYGWRGIAALVRRNSRPGVPR